MKPFKSARHLRRFVSIHDPIANLYNLPRQAFSSSDHAYPVNAHTRYMLI